MPARIKAALLWLMPNRRPRRVALVRFGRLVYARVNRERMKSSDRDFRATPDVG
jgi:hypothetical protein